MMQIHHCGDHRAARKSQYPPLGDQWDVLWRWVASLPPELLNDEMLQMLDRIKAIKTNFPKPRQDKTGGADSLEGGENGG
ncbi:hypothetical protein AA0N74_01640 [Chromobacterium vaccinii]|uniref:hypothetical protein n=1 Tax=Chromobacterium vaccinii TaxID=1108595 RepID=UPI0031CEDF64